MSIQDLKDHGLTDEEIQEIIDKLNEIPEEYIVPNTYHGWEIKMGDKDEEKNH